jgi:tRNA 2-thiouridine synthesizing protein C
MTPRRILFLVAHPPRRGALALETLDELLVGAAFDQKISVLFLGDGVYQLVEGGDTLDSIARSYRALPTYDIDDLYVDKTAIARRRLSIEELVLPTRPLTRRGIQALVAAHDVVVPD